MLDSTVLKFTLEKRISCNLIIVSSPKRECQVELHNRLRGGLEPGFGNFDFLNNLSFVKLSMLTRNKQVKICHNSGEIIGYLFI